MYTKESAVRESGSGAASSVMTSAASGIRDVEKSEGGKCATSLVREGNVGCKWSSAASSGDRWYGCEDPVMFDVQAPDVRNFACPSETERWRESKIDGEKRVSHAHIRQ